MIVVVDYHMGNLKSVERGLCAVGADAQISAELAVIDAAEAIVLPGVGAFADASKNMQAQGQLSLIRKKIAAGVPFLGICLGMHLMFEEGIEGSNFEDEEVENPVGLAVLPGVVKALPSSDKRGAKYKVPHIGWNSIEFDANSDQGQSALLQGITSGEYFYFTHSFVVPDTPCTLAYTNHSITFPSIVSYKERAFGVQFHPEKSSDAGAAVLHNFLTIVKGS